MWALPRHAPWQLFYPLSQRAGQAWGKPYKGECELCSALIGCQLAVGTGASSPLGLAPQTLGNSQTPLLLYVL